MRSHAAGRGVGETASSLKAIHIHYPVSSATITSSRRHFQVDLSPLRLYWSCQPGIHTDSQAYSSSFHFSNTFDHCKLNENNKAVNMKSSLLDSVQNECAEISAGGKCTHSEVRCSHYDILPHPLHLFALLQKIGSLSIRRTKFSLLPSTYSHIQGAYWKCVCF